MNRTTAGILLLLLGHSPAQAGGASQDKLPTPKEQYEALAKEFNDAGRGLWTATTDEERAKAAARGYELTPRVLAFAEKYPNDPVALDALVQVVVQVMWLENNTRHPGFGKDNPATKAVAILLRDHVRSDKLGDPCRRMSYGFSKDCETFLRTVLEKTPHKEIQGIACLRLAQFLIVRSQRLDLLKERPEMVTRYEGLFGKDYLQTLRRQDRAEAIKEAETLFEQATEKHGDVKVPYGGTVGERAKSELHEIRHLSVGKVAPDMEGEDQDGKRFKLSDYRGKVVLVYFWSEF